MRSVETSRNADSKKRKIITTKFFYHVVKDDLPDPNKLNLAEDRKPKNENEEFYHLYKNKKDELKLFIIKIVNKSEIVEEVKIQDKNKFLSTLNTIRSKIIWDDSTLPFKEDQTKQIIYSLKPFDSHIDRLKNHYSNLLKSYIKNREGKEGYKNKLKQAQDMINIIEKCTNQNELVKASVKASEVYCNVMSSDKNSKMLPILHHFQRQVSERNNYYSSNEERNRAYALQSVLDQVNNLSVYLEESKSKSFFNTDIFSYALYHLPWGQKYKQMVDEAENLQKALYKQLQENNPDWSDIRNKIENLEKHKAKNPNSRLFEQGGIINTIKEKINIVTGYSQPNEQKSIGIEDNLYKELYSEAKRYIDINQMERENQYFKNFAIIVDKIHNDQILSPDEKYMEICMEIHSKIKIFESILKKYNDGFRDNNDYDSNNIIRHDEFCNFLKAFQKKAIKEKLILPESAEYKEHLSDVAKRPLMHRE